MANEITISINAQLSNGKLSDPFTPGSIQSNQTTQMAHRPVVTVDTSAWEPLPIGDVARASLGYFMGRNLSTGNYVDVAQTTSSGSTAVHPCQRINAGRTFCFELYPGAFYRWKANTADVKIDMHLWQI